MLELSFGSLRQELSTILCIGAHCDDIEIGCGGTVLRLLESHKNLRVHWVVLSSSEVRAAEARRSAELFLSSAACRDVIIKDFQTSFFPFVGGDIKEFFEKIKNDYDPDLIFTHARSDLHQDHRIVWEFTWNTFRNHLILEYEIPKYDGDLGAPNFFVPLDAAEYDRKIEYLLSCFDSQRNKHWFTRELFHALMRIRGMECNAPSGYAEAFFCRKSVLSRVS